MYIVWKTVVRILPGPQIFLIVTPPHNCWVPPSLVCDGQWEAFPEVKLYKIQINLLEPSGFFTYHQV